MKTIHSLLLVALVAPPLAACNRTTTTPPAAQATAPAAAATSAQPQTALGRAVGSALDKAHEEMQHGNISISDGVHINVNGHQINQPKGEPDAEITPQGDLLIDGHAVAVNADQRALLLAYRGEIMTVAEQGMAMGVKGADLAGKALSETVSSIFRGDTEEMGKRLDAEGKKLEADAAHLCAQLPAMLATQQKLAASLPEFRPYARMTQADVDDCNHHGASVTSR